MKRERFGRKGTGAALENRMSKSGHVRRLWLVGVVLAVVAAGLWGCNGTADTASSGSGADPGERATGKADQGGRVGSGSAAAVSEAALKEGYLAAVEPVIDLGLAGPKEKLPGTFRLVNRGSKALKINPRIGKSCGCVAQVKLAKYALEPGEETTLSFVYTTKSRAGQVIQSLKVKPEPPAGPEVVTLQIKSTVRELVKVEPKQVRFELRLGTTPTATVTVTSVEGEAFAIVGDESPAGVKAVYTSGEKSAEHTVELSVDAGALAAAQKGHVTLTLDHAKVDRVMIGYDVVKRFSVRPGSRAFLGFKKGGVSRAHVVVVSNFGETFELGELTTDKGVVKVLGVQKRADGYQIELEMEAPADVEGNYIDDYLHVPIEGATALKVHCYGVLK